MHVGVQSRSTLSTGGGYWQSWRAMSLLRRVLFVATPIVSVHPPSTSDCVLGKRSGWWRIRLVQNVPHLWRHRLCLSTV
ncbi:unnamed protein product [Calypogeia fissa]